jgi:hypothetical protein
MLGENYARSDDPAFMVRYEARCHCGAVRYEVDADPVDAKICHCLECQRLHGAPMQWAAIFPKRNVRLTAGAGSLRFYSSELRRFERAQPCKVSCARCGTLIADEGRSMWLAFPELFDFGSPRRVPEAFRPRCHIFYESRLLEVADALPKWAGHRDRSRRLS